MTTEEAAGKREEIEARPLLEAEADNDAPDGAAGGAVEELVAAEERRAAEAGHLV